MSKEQKNPLFQLIRSLSKSEKRAFKLFVGRLEKSTHSKFISLFNLLDKMKVYDENLVLKKTGSTRKKLSNLKANLYRQILVSLRLNPHHHTDHIQIRELQDFATVLYNKGLYLQSLRLLEKARGIAEEIDELTSIFEIIEFEKVIESQYITRSHQTRADELAVNAKEISQRSLLASKLSNLSLQLHSFLLKNGYARTEDDFFRIQKYFRHHLPDFELDQLGFREKLYLYQSQLWYSFIIQNFVLGCRYAQKLVNLFKEHPELIRAHPVYCIKAYHYLLESLLYLRHKSQMESTIVEFEKLMADPALIRNQNMKMLSFLYGSFARLNFIFLTGDFKNGSHRIPAIEKELTEFRGKIDAHHVMVFYYKFACMYFGAGHWERSVIYLNHITENKDLAMRADLLCYARILKLIAFYELGWEHHVDSAVVSTYKFLLKMNDLHAVQLEIFKFLRELKTILPSELQSAFGRLYQNLKKMEHHPYEKRSFLYLDILSWLESKIGFQDIGEVISQKVRRIN